MIIFFTDHEEFLYTVYAEHVFAIREWNLNTDRSKNNLKRDLPPQQRRQWHPTPVLLPGKSHGQRSLESCSPWGRWGSDTTERLHFPFSLSCIGEGNGNPLQCSCLENPRDGGALWAAVSGVAQGRTRLMRLSSSSSASSEKLQGWTGKTHISVIIIGNTMCWNNNKWSILHFTFLHNFAYNKYTVYALKDVGTAENETRKPIYKLVCTHSEQLIKLLQGRICYHEWNNYALPRAIIISKLLFVKITDTSLMMRLVSGLIRTIVIYIMVYIALGLLT